MLNLLYGNKRLPPFGVRKYSLTWRFTFLAHQAILFNCFDARDYKNNGKGGKKEDETSGGEVTSSKNN